MANNDSGSKTTAWFIVGFIVIVTAGVIIAGALSSHSGSNNGNPPGFVATTTTAPTASDWTEGNPNAKVSLIEYGDFECPACGDYEPLVQQIVQNYSSSVLFVFRNYPLTSIHPFAMIGSEAAEAAGMEGGAAKYWAMHDLLYKNQTDWSTHANLTPAQVVSQYLNGYAQSLGLNVATFDADMASSRVSTKIQDDVNSGNSASLDHTPTFFVNLAQIPNPQSYNDFQTVIEQAIASSTGSSATGAGVTATYSGSSSTLSVTSTAK